MRGFSYRTEQKLSNLHQCRIKELKLTKGKCFDFLLLPAKECLLRQSSDHRGPAQCVCVADCYYIVNALDLPFASPIAIYR